MPRYLYTKSNLATLQVSGSKGDAGYWVNFVGQFFSRNGLFRHTILIKEGDKQAEKQYEISYPALARYFQTHFDSGVKTMQLVLDKGTTDRSLPNDCHFIENSKTSLVYWYESGSHVSCKALWGGLRC